MVCVSEASSHWTKLQDLQISSILWKLAHRFISRGSTVTNGFHKEISKIVTSILTSTAGKQAMSFPPNGSADVALCFSAL